MCCMMWATPLKKQFLFLKRHKGTLSGSLNNLSLMMTIVLPNISSVSSVISYVWLFANPWTPACQASLSIISSHSLLKLMSIALVTPSNHLILCRPLLLPPTIFVSIRVFSNESILCIKWWRVWSFSFSISLFNEYSGFPLGWTGWISLLSKGLSRVFSNTTIQKHQFFSALLSYLFPLAKRGRHFVRQLLIKNIYVLS